MSSALRFGVDLDELDVTIAAMARCGRALDSLLDEVAHRVALLHETWEGAAAVAQRSAQAEWESGLREMSVALAAMRAAGGVARDSYLEAATANRRMWEQLS